MKLQALCRTLDYTFKQRALLHQALTHRSATGLNNERLEFLGDAILSLVIAEDLYARYPRAKEGELSRLRSSLVKGETLAELAQELSLGDYLKLGPGELKSGGFRRSSILADAFEALLGAIYLDSGLEACRRVVLRLFQDKLAQLPKPAQLKDPKSRLQEYLQSASAAATGI